MAKGQTGEGILDRWDEVRREKWHKVINPVSSANIKRLNSVDPDRAVEQDAFFHLLNKAEKTHDYSILKPIGDVLSFLLKLMKAINSIQYDFSADFEKYR